MAAIHAVLFDLDNTLYDREEAFLVWADDFLRHDLKLADEGEIAVTLQSLREMDAAGYGSKAAIFAHLRDLFPGHSVAVNMTLAQWYERFLTFIRLEPDTQAILNCLKSLPMPFGVVTNGGPRQWDKLKRLGLNEVSNCLFVSHDVGISKPDPRIFHAAAECLATKPENILFVGDNPVLDIGGAQRAGMITAWLSRGLPWPDDPDLRAPDFTLATLIEVLDILGARRV
jgi:putative hydrolase of the HAD superfamily